MLGSCDRFFSRIPDILPGFWAAEVPSGPEADVRGPRGQSVSGLETLALNRTKERRAEQRPWQVGRVSVQKPPQS